MNIAKRVGALEGKTGNGGFDQVHRIICKGAQTADEALGAYGRDRIGPNDFVIIRQFVAPPVREGSVS